ncbi:putative rRNA maturation factor [Trypanosoma rangeli]|uniref:Putative rRNA maturation factor n=1 Tax=Trypanosoma rangeli TaxID=5698 RepID=A0A3R7KIB7_TRYRA|nr:putative rRNA maturation factor [Trypanosoma rangeli]RNF07035.1 putative rRNA maturation factor [Trypanosoma rangeli]|eukprot:RNF07035.1 putative rRNA maturation factor [Trypanosoma rangeli]
MPRPFFRRLRVHGATHKFGVAVQRLTETVLWLERAPPSVELSIHFIRSSQMHLLNYNQRGIDRPTDVLTFPGSGSGTPDALWANEVLFSNQDNLIGLKKSLPAQECTGLSRRDVLLDLGEIYVSVEDIWMRCLRYPQKNLRFHDYLQVALVHALLHALGYDHDAPERWRKMSRRERSLLRQLDAFRRRWPGCLMELDGIELIASVKS